MLFIYLFIIEIVEKKFVYEICFAILHTIYFSV